MFFLLPLSRLRVAVLQLGDPVGMPISHGERKMFSLFPLSPPRVAVLQSGDPMLLSPIWPMNYSPMTGNVLT
jgi:hypothetical protein